MESCKNEFFFSTIVAFLKHLHVFIPPLAQNIFKALRNLSLRQVFDALPIHRVGKLKFPGIQIIIAGISTRLVELRTRSKHSENISPLKKASLLSSLVHHSLLFSVYIFSSPAPVPADRSAAQHFTYPPSREFPFHITCNFQAHLSTRCRRRRRGWNPGSKVEEGSGYTRGHTKRHLKFLHSPGERFRRRAGGGGINGVCTPDKVPLCGQ